MAPWEAVEGDVLDDRYEIRGLLGRGGAGVVHRAWDRERAREVAVKSLPPGADDRERRGEAAMLRTLDHPRIVALLDVLDTPSGVALVLELVDGPSLAARLRTGPLSAAEARTVLRDVASALAHAHRRGIVHRDVKAGNVLLELEQGVVVRASLSDFGIARRSDATRTTAEATIVGTLRFLSPEQARGERTTSASDVYSLGLTVLAALTGEDAFPGTRAETLAARILRPPRIPASLPDDLGALLADMTALDPADRIDASDTAARACALDERPTIAVAASDSVPGPTTRPARAGVSTTARRRHGLVGAVAGAALVGVLAGGAVAAVVAPTEADRTVAEAIAGPAGTSSAAHDVPVAATTTSTAPAPATAADRAPAVPAVQDDHGGDRRRDDSSGKGSSHGSGHGSDDRSGSSGHGSGD